MRRLLVIDFNITTASPSMRGWLAAAEGFLSNFDEVVVWADQNELTGPNVAYVPTTPNVKLGPLAPLHFAWEVNRRFKKLPPGYLAETLIQCTGCTLPFADIRFIHFWNLAFLKTAEARGDSLKMSLRERAFRGWAASQEKHALISGNTREWWCVSRGIAEPIEAADRNTAVFRFIPNAYDAARFNTDTRRTWRTVMRKQYGLADDETVFCFSAFGHFERKGLRQAAAAVDEIAKKGLQVKLLVLGGKPQALENFKSSLSLSGVDLSNLIFAGMVTHMEHHLSAADALFFPSHFEAFSLAEIEAAALGLRLYLTAHPGQEMILREGINGRLLPWSVHGMTEVLAEEIRSGKIRVTHHEMGEALKADEYKATVRKHFENAISAKWPEQQFSS